MQTRCVCFASAAPAVDRVGIVAGGGYLLFLTNRDESQTAEHLVMCTLGEAKVDL
jgi:hypothetical protein